MIAPEPAEGYPFPRPDGKEARAMEATMSKAPAGIDTAGWETRIELADG